MAPHLMLDGFSTKPELLDDAQFVRQFIVDLAALSKMTIINGPTIVSFKDMGIPDAGLSAFAIIAESNICLHTWPEKNYVTVDLFSCRDFDWREAEAFIRRTLAIGNIQRRQVLDDRGGPPTLAEFMKL